MSSVMNPFIALTVSTTAALTTSTVLEVPIPFPGEVVSASLMLNTAVNTGADLLASLSKNGTASVTATSALSISSIGVSGSVVTITTGAAHGLSVGNQVVISNATNSANNGFYTIATVPSTTTFTINNGTAFGVTTALVAQASSGGYVTAAASPIFSVPASTALNTPQTIVTAASTANGVNQSGTGSTATGITQNNLGAAVTPLLTFASGDKVGVKVNQIGSTVAGSGITLTLLVIKK